MNITVIEGVPTSYGGDLSFKSLEDLGNLKIYEKMTEEGVYDRLKISDAVITNRIHITKELIDFMPNLKYIGTFATGFNMIDIEYAKSKNIPVCNVPNYCLPTVTQMVFALLFALTNHVAEHTELVREGNWDNSIVLTQQKHPFIELCGKTMGIVGYGNLGRNVARIAESFGMNVIVYSKSPKEIQTHSLEYVFKNSDVVSLHCALNSETTGMINTDLLKIMKSSAFLINTARGALINENDLANALNAGLLGGAGIDVMTLEPPENDNPLFTAKNCYITPHIAWSSKEARQRLVDVAANNIAEFVKGNIVNRVN